VIEKFTRPRYLMVMATLTRTQIVLLAQTSMKALESGRIGTPPLKGKYAQRLKELKRKRRIELAEPPVARAANSQKFSA
jgi:hypothetical protein